MSDEILEAEEEAFGITDRLVAEVIEAVGRGSSDAIDALLDPLHPADIAHLLELIDDHDRRALLSVWKGGMDGDILSELDEGLRDEIVESLEPSELADVVRELESDDVVDLVESLEEEQQEAVLGALEASERVAVEQALTYPEEFGRPSHAVRGGAGARALDGGRGHRPAALGHRAAGPVLPCHSGRSADARGGLCHAWPHPVIAARHAAARAGRGQFSHRFTWPTTWPTSPRPSTTTT